MSSTRDKIFEAIRANKPTTEFAYPRIPVFDKSSKDILQEFKESLVVGAGTWNEVASKEEAGQLIKKLYPDAKVICSATPEIAGNRDLPSVQNPHELNDVDVGIIRAQFGVSETGMVWLTEEDMIVPSLGFLSQNLVILLDPTQLVRDMYEAYSRIRLEKDNYGCFMLGPSGTADIGAVMVHGAQGAKTLTVLFM